MNTPHLSRPGRFDFNHALLWLRSAASHAAMVKPTDVVVTSKPDGSLVTSLDLDLARSFQRFSAHHFPGHAVLTEETKRPERIDSDRPVWILDPLDGTYDWVNCGYQWSIALAVYFQEQIVWGAIAMPGQDLFVVADEFGFSPLRRSRVLPFWSKGEGTRVLTNFSGLKYFEGAPENLSASLGPSIAGNMAHVALGGAHVFFAPQAKIWDIAAGSALLEKRSLSFMTLAGEPVVLKGLPESHEMILGGVEPHLSIVQSFLNSK